MKYFLVLLIYTFVNSCNSQNEIDAMIITYEAVSRGNSIEIYATSKLITYKNLDNNKQLKPASKDWNDLIGLINEIKLDEMKNFNSPSEDRFVDAALQATLSIALNETTYSSQSFDHGTPPKELKEIIDKLFEFISE